MSITEPVFWLWRKAFPAARKWKNAPVINIWKLGKAGWVTQPDKLRTGDATSLGRMPDDWLLSCPEDQFTELRARAAGAHGTRGHLKVTSCRNLNKKRQSRKKSVFSTPFSSGCKSKQSARTSGIWIIQQRKSLKHACISSMHPVPTNPVWCSQHNTRFRQVTVMFYCFQIKDLHDTIIFTLSLWWKQRHWLIYLNF